MLAALLFLSACSLKPLAPVDKNISNDTLNESDLDIPSDLNDSSDLDGSDLNDSSDLNSEEENLLIDKIDSANIDRPIIGGDQDEFGCKGSAGYTWCEAKNKCLRIWEENCYSGLSEEMKYLLAKKYGKNPSEVNIMIDKQTDNHAVGSVSFDQNGETGEQGKFLCVLKNGVWSLVYDSHDSVDCKELRTRYNFPDEIIVPQFCD